MRPQSPLTKEIIAWIDKSSGWFSYFRIDAALGIEGKKDKTLRRVIIKRLLGKGKLLKAPGVNGAYRKLIPAKIIKTPQGFVTHMKCLTSKLK